MSASPAFGRLPLDRTCLANKLILALGITALIVSGLARLNQSLWLDELITAWVIRDTWQDVVMRSTTFQGQSPFYFLFPWSVKQIFGFHEWSLRVPSLLWNIGTLGCLYGVIRRIRGRDLAACGVASCALIMSTAPSLHEARPYALALFLFTLSLDILVCWALSGKRAQMVCFILAVTGTFYSHYLFALGFPLYGVVLVYLRPHLRLSWTDLARAVGAFLLLAVPAVWQLYLLAGKASVYSYSGAPTLARWLTFVFRDQETLALLVGTALSLCLARNIRHHDFRRYRSLFFLGMVFWWYPGNAVAVVSFLSGTPIFELRYCQYGILGESLVQAVLLCCIRSSWHRMTVFSCLTIYVFASNWTAMIWREDWRGALAKVSSSVTSSSIVLLQSGLCETRDISWLKSSEKRDYLLSPITFYSLDAPTLLIPYFLDGGSPQEIFSNTERSLLSKAQRIFIVGPSFMLFQHEILKGKTVAKLPWLSSDGVFEVVSENIEKGMFIFELKPNGEIGDLVTTASQH